MVTLRRDRGVTIKDFGRSPCLTLLVQPNVDFGYRKPGRKDAIADLSLLRIVSGDNPDLFAVFVSSGKNSASGRPRTVGRENHVWGPFRRPLTFRDGAEEGESFGRRGVKKDDEAALGVG